MLELGLPALREGVVAAQEQQPVRPGGVGHAATPVVAVPAHAATNGGEHVVAEPDQVEVVDRDAGLGQPAADSGAKRSGGVDPTTSTRRRHHRG